LKKHLRKIFFVIGLLLFAWVVYRLNPAVIWTYLKEVGANFFWILLVSVLWYGAYALAWEIFLKNLSKRVRFWEIFRIKIVGETINNLTPFSWGGGDPARVLMLKEHIPLTEGTASVIVDRTLNNLAVALFMLVGVIITLWKFRLSPALLAGVLVALGIILSVSILFFLRSREGLFEFFIDLLKRLRIKRQFSPKTLQHAREIDGHISHFYRMNRRGFALAFLLHLFGRGCGVVEIYLAARFIHHPLTLIDSYLLATMTVIVNMVFVFVPGSLGVLEGAFAGIFGLLHMNPAVGTSIQMVRRTRMIFWTAAGFVLMGKKKRATP
jgi:conserved hypothetical protein